MADDARRLAAEIADLRREVRALATATRLGDSSIEFGTTEIYDDNDVLRQIVGEQFDGTYTAIDLNGAPPPEPYPASLSTTPGLLIVNSFGTTLDGSDWPLDFKRIDVHVGTTGGFTPTAATKVAEFTADGGSITLALDPALWWVTLVAVNTSGAESPPSAYSSLTVDPAATGAGGVATYHSNAAPVGLDATDDGAIWYDTDAGNLPNRWDGATLTWVPLTIGGSAIAANAIDGTHLSADAIDGKTIIGAAIKTAATGTRIELTGPGSNPYGELGMLALYHHVAGWTPGIVYAKHDDANNLSQFGIQGPYDEALGNPMSIVMTYTDDGNTRTLATNAKRTVMNGGVALGGLSREINGFDFGTISATTDANGHLTINHDLGSVPNCIQLTNDQSNGRTASVNSKTATNFVIEVRDGDNTLAANNTVAFNWLAIT